MIILWIALAILVVNILIRVIVDLYQYDLLDILNVILIAFSALVIVTTLIVWPINYYSGKASIQEYHALRMAIKESRKDSNPIENAALTTKIAKFNQDLASIKYWNDTSFDWFIPDDLADLPYLK